MEILIVLSFMDYFRDDTIKNYQIKLINGETIHGYSLLILKLIPFYFDLCFDLCQTNKLCRSS